MNNVAKETIQLLCKYTVFLLYDLNEINITKVYEKCLLLKLYRDMNENKKYRHTLL